MSITLHKVGWEWWIGDYKVSIIRQGKLWRLDAPPVPGSADRLLWLEKNRLKDKLFPTRRDALEAFELAEEFTPEGCPKREIPCRRVRPGHYRLAGGAQARKIGSRWVVSLREKVITSEPTLWRAAVIAEAKHRHQNQTDQ